MRKTSYLIKQTDRNYFSYQSKFNIPVPFQNHFGRKSFKISLKSGNYNECCCLSVEFKEEKIIVNCIMQIARYLESKNLEFELVERLEINDDFIEVRNLPLVKINKLIDQLNEGLKKLQTT